MDFDSKLLLYIRSNKIKKHAREAAGKAGSCSLA